MIPHEIWYLLRYCWYARDSYFAKIRSYERVRNKEGKINVVFFAIIESHWKYDSLYQAMLLNSNFNPIILVCPVVNRGSQYMLDCMRKCCDYFERKKYQYICSYNTYNNTYIDARELHPDIIFYTNPYESLIDSRYYINNFKDVLSCYVNYFYVGIRGEWTCSSLFHRYVWRYYIENEVLLSQIRHFTLCTNRNCRVVGYPLFDTFRAYHSSDDDWPIKGGRKKRIIWAPHHTVSNSTGIYAMSTFERYFELMLLLAEQYKDEIQIVFKPHPWLKANLYELEGWGKERTDAYYRQWSNGENTAYVDGEYIGLFLSSDAMIHDCQSFTVEYLATQHPVMFLDSGKTDNMLNDISIEARACHYKGYSAEDIERFIQDVVLGGKDDLSGRREAFYKNYILPPNGKLAAENIIDDLLSSLGRK